MNKNKTVTLSSVIILLIIFGCNQSAKQDFIGNYQIDKIVSIDTTIQTRHKVENINSWTIYLGDENFFKIQKANKTINGIWELDKIEGGNQFIDFQFGNLHTLGRLNGNIIYFDKPNILLDSLFKNAIFVKLKDTK